MASIWSAWGIAVFIFVWVLLGLVAFVWSIVCFTKPKSNVGFDIGGLLIAIFLGPLWFLYLIILKPAGYCND
jgi:hypothetical protein